ncbi:MAG: family transporter [Vampirovibrio sp.]|jgi:predicted PurR-regulated permease PerM|nr:family transporter [Vampirovibrio sp.]
MHESHFPDGSRPTEDNQDTALLSPATKINLILLCALFLIAVGLLLTQYLTVIVLLLAASLILTYILLDPVGLIETGLLKVNVKGRALSQKAARAVAILVVYLLFFGLIIFSVLRIVPPLSLQIKDFAKDIPTYLSHMASDKTGAKPQTAPPTEPLVELVQESLQESKQQKVGNLTVTSQTNITVTQNQPSLRKTSLLSATYKLALAKLAANYKLVASKLGGFILDLGAITLNSLIYVLTTLVLVFYLLHDGRELKNGFVDLMPSQNEASVNRFLKRVHLQFHTIIKGQVLMSFLSGGLIYALSLALDVKYALLLGVFFGIVSILPVIGPWIGLIPIVAILAFSSHPNDILQVLLVTGLFYILKTYWLWPKLIHRRYDVHPILFILTFLVCLKLTGALGMLLAFPLASVLAAFAHTLKASHTVKPHILEPGE